MTSGRRHGHPFADRGISCSRRSASNSNNESNNNSPPNQPASAESTSPIDTPEIKPTAATYNVQAAPSPTLDALSNASVSTSTAPSMTQEWPRNAGFSGSPGNLISVMGDSPPTQPSSYEDSGARLHQGWSASKAGYMSASPASSSPPNIVRPRPISYHMESPLGYTPDSIPQASPPGFRRSSLHSQLSHARAGSHPPLPHHTQAHFYGAPDLDSTLRPQSGMKAGDRGYHFGYDKLPSLPESPYDATDVIVAGYEGGLDIYAVSKKGVDPIAGLKGLKGGVVHAKILPWSVTGDLQEQFPLVAVVLHGPVLSPTAGSTAPSVTASPRIDGAASPRSTYGQDGPPAGNTRLFDSYQTSVQIYSLATNKLVDVLLQSSLIPISPAIGLTSPAFIPPPPAGSFTIKADGGIVAVCSCATGECWVYTQLSQTQNAHLFACIGKLWTSCQQSPRTEMSEEQDGSYNVGGPLSPAMQTPVFALNGKWIAYCPAAPSSQIALRAHVPVPIYGKGPGLSSLSPPSLPTPNASVDLISDSVMNKIMRETTQELISGAKWVGQQSMQAWQSYWNKSPPQTQQPQSRPAPAQFPPTHATANNVAPKDPGLVNIVDVNSLVDSAAVHPLASFAPPSGCSFLSFSPSSLALFTASSKGDVQNVWDLFRLQHTKYSPLQGTITPSDNAGLQIRQIAQFSRMTVARIVDVVWAAPLGERIAMVTERGTVHLLDMPLSAFMWPAPRRRQAAQENKTEGAETTSSAVAIATGAFGAAYQAAMPFVSRSRRSSASPTAQGSTFKDTAAQGGRVIAATISNSLGKTGTAINQFRHAGENRVSLPTSTSRPSGACVSWIRGRKTHTLFSLGDGVVRVYPNRSRTTSISGMNKRHSRIARYTDFKIHGLPDDIVSPAVRQIVDLGAQDEVLDLTEQDMEAGNTLTLNKKGRPAPAFVDQGMDAAIPQAEIESSAPYQPFHTDRRVTLCEYSQNAPAHIEDVSALMANAAMDEKSSKKKSKKQPRSGAAPAEDSVWAFGQDIPVTKLDLGLAPMMDEDFGPDDQALPPSAMERVMQYGDAEQIVVTTRKRRGARQGDIEGDGFFEDDCEVLDFADQRV